MGTSANLVVKLGDKVWRSHTSYDGYLGNVFPQLLSTMAAVGLDNLRAAFAVSEVVSDQDISEEEGEEMLDGISSRETFDAYLLAAQANGQDPHLMLESMQNSFGTLDFAHGGLIPMFAPRLLDASAWGPPEEADFTLDLDAGTLVATLWLEGSEAAAPFTVSLRDFDGLAPEHVEEAVATLLDSADFAMEEAEDLVGGQAALQELAAAIRAGDWQPTPPAVQASNHAALVAEFANDDDFPLSSFVAPSAQLDQLRALPAGGPGPNGKGYHLLLLHPVRVGLLRALETTLSRWAEEVPGLARLATDARIIPPQPGSPEAPIGVLVDLRQGFAEPGHALAFNNFMGSVCTLLQDLGVHCESSAAGIFSAGSSHGLRVVSSMAQDEEEFGVGEGLASIEDALVMPLRTRAAVVAVVAKSVEELEWPHAGEMGRYIGHGGALPLLTRGQVVAVKKGKAHFLIEDELHVLPLSSVLPENPKVLAAWLTINSAYVAGYSLLDAEIIAAIPDVKVHPVLQTEVETALSEIGRITQSFEPGHRAASWAQLPRLAQETVLGCLGPSARYAFERSISPPPRSALKI